MHVVERFLVHVLMTSLPQLAQSSTLAQPEGGMHVPHWYIDSDASEARKRPLPHTATSGGMDVCMST